MQKITSKSTSAPSDKQIMARRMLSQESRPSRMDMLRLYQGDIRKLNADTVCTGNCVYCDANSERS